MPDTVARQTEQSLLNIGAILAEAGCSFDNVVNRPFCSTISAISGP